MGFLRFVKLFSWGLKFYDAMIRIFIFPNASIEKEICQRKNLIQKVNMDNYQVTSRRGFGILSPPNWTSPFAFIPHVRHSVPEMETLTDELVSYTIPN